MDHVRIAFIFSVIIHYIYADRGRLHMLESPISLTMPINDEATLECKMNTNADRFIWNFYALPAHQVANPSALLEWERIKPVQISDAFYRNEKKSSKLKINCQNSSVAGDYQCVPYYGASAIASPPGRITMTYLGEFARQANVSMTVTDGNTIVYRCEPPTSNPPAYIDYYKDRNHITPKSSFPRTQSLILHNISYSDTGTYTCSASNNIEGRRVDANFRFNLRVTSIGPHTEPFFITPPRSAYYVEKGEEVFLECSAVGTPVPYVTWQKIDGELPTKRTEMFPGGLRIFDVSPEDDGLYMCKYTNSRGVVSAKIELKYRESPTITEGLRNTNRTEGDHFGLQCNATGRPDPKIIWLLNGKSVINDTAVELSENRISFKPLHKRHAGFIQCFARNDYGVKYSTAELRVVPKIIKIKSTDLMEDYSTHPPQHKRRKNKKGKGPKGSAQMIPPSKPTVSRINDESVVVRWTVPMNNGLPIQFFKVQYQELGPLNPNGTASLTAAKWKTCNLDIPPNIKSYEVNNLKPEQVYKFRIAAVYSNNDNQLSSKSDRFYLNRTDFFMKNPLPVPRLIHTERINTTAIKIVWEYAPIPNISIDGFFINYMSASSAGDYMKETVDGEWVNSYVLTHLQPDTVYDIKMQSFNAKSASEFSPILKQSTAKLIIEDPVTTSVPSTNVEESSPIIYVIIGIVALAILVAIIVLYLVCKKCRCGANMEDMNHHYPTEDNNYSASRTYPRTNGVSSNPRMTITSNPLADADNKNQNVMMEMSCLSIQNNNCSTTTETSPTTNTTTTNNRDIGNESLTNKKGKINNNKKRHDLQRENYV